MATRRERVVLDVESNVSASMMKDAAATALLKRELNSLSKTAVQTRGSVGGLNDSSSGLPAMERNAGRSGASINQLSGRLAILVKTAAALGPALVPITTAAVPAIAGLSTVIGFAVVAAGTAVLAFQGVGDALKALNDAHLKPTTANLAKAREAMAKLSPAARDLVRQLREMGPAFRALRVSAAEGLLPGVSQALDEIESRLPDVERILNVIGDSFGDSLASGAESLAGRRWDDFFDFIETEARPTLTSLGKSIGNITHGLAEMWMAFDPVSDDFTAGLLNASNAFDDWAAGLSQTEGFQEFIAYIQATGPQVLDTLGSIGDAFLQIAEAAAPLGGPILEILEAVADVIALIADSPLGTPIMALVAALSAANLATLAWGKASKSSFANFTTGQVKASAGIKTLRADLSILNRQAALVTLPDKNFIGPLTEAQAALGRVRSSVGMLAKQAGVGALGVGALAASMQGSQAATFGLTGAMLGGAPGAVAGGLIGTVMDFTAVARSADQTTRAWAASLRTAGTDFSGMAQVLSQAGDDVNAALEDIRMDSIGSRVRNILDPDLLDVGLSQILGGKSGVEKKQDARDDLRNFVDDVKMAAASLQDIGGDTSDLGLTKTLTAAKPALDALGISIEDVSAAVRDGSWVEMRQNIIDWSAAADSADGRTKHLADTVMGLDSQMLSAADAAVAFGDALDALTSPAMNQRQALIAWKNSLMTLKGDLAENSRSLNINTLAGQQNQQAILDRVSALTTTLKKDAEAGASSAELARKLRQGKKAILEAADAAGLNRDQVAKMINEMNLTPETIRTLIEVTGADKARREAESVRRSLAAIKDKTVQITVNQLNAINKPKSPSMDPSAADGGTVPKTGRHYADRHHYLLADGEEVISNRHGQADRNRSLLKAINAGLADGGTAMAAQRGGYVRDARSAAGRSSGPSSMVVTGTLQTPWGPAHIEGLARDVAREEIDADRRFESVRSGHK